MNQQGVHWITPKSEFEDTGQKNEVGWAHPAALGKLRRLWRTESFGDTSSRLGL